MRSLPTASTLILFLALTAFDANTRQFAFGEQPEGKAGQQLEQVIVVFKTHFDIGYTELARNVVQRYRTSMIDKALAVCDHTRKLPEEHRFVWTLPGWPMSQILWPDQTPQRRERIAEAIRDGRLVWHALPGTTHTESLDLEDFVRGMNFSSRLSRQFGMPLARDAKMTDVPSHCWILPTILKHAGVDFLHLGCNSASGSPDVPRLFWWEGPDGSRLLTMYEASGYGSGLKPPEGWSHKTWLALIHTGDNQGPPAPDQVQKLLDQARAKLPGVKIRMGRLSDFGDAIRAENPDLPVVRADMPDTWIHGLMSMPQESKIARNIRPQIGVLDALNTLLTCWKVDVSGVKEVVAGAYEGSLMYGEHTWGYSMSPFGYRYGKEWADAHARGHYARLEESWGEHGAYVRKARQLVTPALAENTAALARGVKIAGPRIVVFNPLPWTRDDVVSVEVPPRTASGLKDAMTGDAVPAEIEATTLRFVAHDVPAMGYRTYVPATVAAAGGDLIADADSATIQNAAFRLRLDPSRGVVASLVDKRSGREFVDATSKYGFGQYLYERFDEDNIKTFFKAYLKYVPGWAPHFARGKLPAATEVAYSAASPEDFTLTVRRGAVSAAATMTATTDKDVPCTVALTVTLYRDQPYVDLEWIVTGKKPDPWPEAGWLCLPLGEEKPSFRLGRLGSLVDPAKDVCGSSNFEVFCLSSGMTVAGPGGVGVGLCPVDSPLVSIGRPGVYRYSREFGKREPVLFVNLFNNVWGTNFQQWIGGSLSSRVRLWSVDGKGPEADLITPSWEARSDCGAVFFDGPAGKLPPSQAGLELSRKGVLVTTFGPNPDGDGILLRLWEQVGEDGICRVRLPEGMDVGRAQPCDLRGRPQGEPIPVHDGSFEILLSHYSPASLILQRRP